jgi:DNA invertase Pin-like site-specific DNA recombinase
MATFVAYYRVSTPKQGASGLGLEAQRASVEEHLLRVGGKQLAAFTEVETGSRNDRPKLQEALLRCRQTNSILLVAKLDRLGRDAAFLIQLRNSSTKFVCADMPEANELTISLLAIVAEHERKMISKRTKEALQAAKARGVKLGNPQLKPGSAHTARQASMAASEAYSRRAEDLRPMIESAGVTDLKELCTYMDLMGVKSPLGKSNWNVPTMKRLVSHLAKVPRNS